MPNPHPFEHDAVQLRCDLQTDHPELADDDEWAEWLRHIEG